MPPGEAEILFWEKSSHWTPAPGIFETLRFIRESELPMGVVSNSAFSGRVIEGELEMHGLRRFFDFVISSSDYGLRKPSPLIFELAAAKMGLCPPEILFIGDDMECDIQGSRHAGMSSLHYTGRKKESHLPENEILENWPDLIKKIRNIPVFGQRKNTDSEIFIKEHQ